MIKEWEIVNLIVFLAESSNRHVFLAKQTVFLLHTAIFLPRWRMAKRSLSVRNKQGL